MVAPSRGLKSENKSIGDPLSWWDGLKDWANCGDCLRRLYSTGYCFCTVQSCHYCGLVIGIRCIKLRGQIEQVGSWRGFHGLEETESPRSEA